MNTKRVTSAGSMRSVPVGNGSDTRILQAKMEKLQQELLISHAETQKVTDQLNCLIMLVKRAFTGDKGAAVHVATIVGVAPPDLQEVEYHDHKVMLAAKPKSKAVNHWAVLTIGLLNREYRQQEQEVEDKQWCHLQIRQDYLERQLMNHKVQQAPREHQENENHVLQQPKDSPNYTPYRHNSWTGNSDTFMTQPPQHNIGLTHPKEMPEKLSISKPPAGSTVGQRRPSAKQRPLYRSQTAEPVHQDPNIKWADLFIEPAGTSAKLNKNTNQVLDGLGHLGEFHTENPDYYIDDGEDIDHDRMDVTYDDPRRYSKFGLFDVDAALGPETQRKRPVSAKLLKHGDSLRARPKSAVLAKPERPLKYETTRPISAKIANKNFKDKNSTQANSTKQKLRSQSAKELNTGHKLSNKEREEELALLRQAKAEYDKQQEFLQKAKDILKEEEAEDMQAALEREHRGTEEGQIDNYVSVLEVKIRKPKCVEQFELDLQSMDLMEKDFKKAAVDLQKKLGITSDGMIQ